MMVNHFFAFIAYPPSTFLFNELLCNLETLFLNDIILSSVYQSDLHVFPISSQNSHLCLFTSSFVGNSLNSCISCTTGFSAEVTETSSYSTHTLLGLSSTTLLPLTDNKSSNSHQLSFLSLLSQGTSKKPSTVGIAPGRRQLCIYRK